MAAHADPNREGHAITQQAPAERTTEGHDAAHVRRMRVLSARRRALLGYACVQEAHIAPAFDMSLCCLRSAGIG